MFVRTKRNPNSPRTAVQNFRVDNKIKQKIIRHVGVAEKEKEIEKLKELAEYLLIKIEVTEDPQLNFFTPDELIKMIVASRQNKKDEKHLVNVKNLREESRVTVGIHETFGQIYKDIGFHKLFKNPARQVAATEKLFDIVMARIANPVSKRASIFELEKHFGKSYSLDSVYKMMDKIDDAVKQDKRFGISR